MNSDTLKDASIAIAHGNYLGRGGGEHVAEEIARAFDAPLYYGFGDPDNVPDDIDATSLANHSRLKRFAGSKLVRDSYYYWNFKHIPELYDYDVIIQSGNEFGWFVPKDDQTILRYVHSTPRTPFDRYSDKGDKLKEAVYSEACRVLTPQTYNYPDLLCANSEVIVRRINKYYGRTDGVRVLYPPVDVDSYPLGTAADRESDLYVTYSRLYPAKRIEEIVEAFRSHPDKRLVIGGTGPERDRLDPDAPDNVDFRGYLSESEKRDLLRRATAGIFAARNEDFGLVPVEMFAAGCPVIGVRDGFTQHQIEDGQTGIIFDRGSDNLSRAIDRFETTGVSASHREIAAVARQFSKDRFENELRDAVREALQRTQVSCSFAPPSVMEDSEPTAVATDGGTHE